MAAFPAIAEASHGAIVATLREAYEVRERLTCDQWAAKYRRIPERGNPEPGLWRNERTPFCIEPMRACSDPSIRQITAMKGSQLGFTDAMVFNRMGWAIDMDPGPELIIMPNDRLSRQTVKKRLRPSIKASPTLAAKYSSGKAESSMDVLVFTTMDVTICGSNSATNVRSTPYRRVTIDDFDLCEPSSYEEGTQRTGAFEALSPLMTCVGTPSFWGSGIHSQYLDGDRRRYLCPCPHCGAYQEWRFDNLTWSGGIQADPGKVMETAFMRCSQCSSRIENHDKPWCLEWGCWQPEGVGVVVPANLREPGAFRAWSRTEEARAAHEIGIRHPALETLGEPEHPSKGHRSYRISSLYSPFKSFGWVAEGFIRSGGRPERDWVNGKLGEPWRVAGEDVNLDTVRRLCVPLESGGYEVGTIPEDCIVLTAGIDVGADHVWVLTVGYTERMGVGCWIEGRRIEAMRGNLTAIVPELKAIRYPHKAGGTMRPLFWFIDSRHRTQEVYDLCEAMGRSLCFPVLGVGREAPPVEAKRFQKGPDGEPLPQSLTRMLVNTNHWSEVMWARLFTASSADKAEQAEIIKVAAPELMRLPANLPANHALMFTAEECTEGVWKKKDGREDNHLLDAWRYGEAGLFKADGRHLTSRLAMEKTGLPRFGWDSGEEFKPQTPMVTAATRTFRAPDLPLKDRFRRRP